MTGEFKLSFVIYFWIGKNTSTLINPRFITGLDEALLDDLKKRHTLVVTLEDGVLDGGFGEKIARYYGPSEMKVLNYGVRKEFIDRFDVSEQLLKNRLTAPQIVEDTPIKASLLSGSKRTKRRIAGFM